jgi:hypothetical protein
MATALTDYIYTEGTETWQVTGPGTIWVWQMDPRTKGYTKQKVGGSDGGSKFLRISIDDRRYNEQQIVEEMSTSNPFRNGALKFLRVDGAPEDYVPDIDSTYHLTLEELKEFFTVKDGEVFRATIEDISSELVLRRLRDVGGKEATMEQMEILSEIIDARYKQSKSQKAIREEANPNRAATPLS